MLIHPAGAVYVLLVGLGAPVLAVRTARRLEAMSQPLSRELLVRSAFLSFVLLGALSWVTARAIGMPWAVVRSPDLRGALLVAGALVLMLASASVTWRTRPASEREELLAVLPATRAQAAVWVAMAIGAGVFEEIAWRSVLFANVAELVHSGWMAAVLCSASFGVSHAYQGRHGMVATGAFALLMHALVALTGSLLPAIVVHALYDIGVGFLFRELARRDGTAAGAPEGS